jgi:hypothetical protein
MIFGMAQKNENKLLREKIFGEIPIENLRRQVIGTFKELIMIDPAECDRRIAGIEKMEREGLLKVLKILAEGVSEQHDYFTILTSRDHKFPTTISVALYDDQMKKI